MDFFSIGSNDLTQYLLAVDRDNAKVTRHYNSLNPAFLRALDYAVQAVHRQGKWIGLLRRTWRERVCAPSAGRFGTDEISMSAPSIPAAKARMAQLDSRACRQLLNQAMACRTSLEVEHLLAQFRMTQQDGRWYSPMHHPEQRLAQQRRGDQRMNRQPAAGKPLPLPAQAGSRSVGTRGGLFHRLGFSFAIPHSKSEHI